MNINKANYESFFLDYHEGNLSDELKRDVLAFVNSNPELKEEFESFEIISLNAKPSITFPGKEKLKKNTITEYNYKTWFVAYEEDDLNAQEKKEVEQFVETNPGYKPELEILRQTRVLPDYSIRFANKSSLKKGGAVIPMWVRVAVRQRTDSLWRAAACLVIGLLSYLLIEQKLKQEVASTEQPNGRNADLQIKNETAEKIKPIIADKKEVAIKNNSSFKTQKQLKRKAIEKKIEENLAIMDSTPANKRDFTPEIQSPIASNQQQAASSQQPATITINENKKDATQQNQKFVVLDDNDLAELGLKNKPEVENNSLLADAVNGVGKLFKVNAHYDKEHDALQSKYTETLALGPLAITRTVPR